MVSLLVTLVGLTVAGFALLTVGDMIAQHFTAGGHWIVPLPGKEDDDG